MGTFFLVRPRCLSGATFRFVELLILRYLSRLKIFTAKIKKGSILRVLLLRTLDNGTFTVRWITVDSILFGPQSFVTGNGSTYHSNPSKRYTRERISEMNDHELIMANPTYRPIV